jgi:outer membrane scaffolding protein for murein synthesis (MipA/OmpV family)
MGLGVGAAALLALMPMGLAQAQTQPPAPAAAPEKTSLPEPPKTVELPLWEFGLGIGAVSFRDYRGSDTTHAYPVPVPYFIYRGQYLQADRSGLKSKLLHQDRVELNVSLNATTPVRNNATREGMPQLRSTVEIGPALEVHVWRSKSEDVRFDVRLPVRAAFAVGRPGYIGWFFTPNVNVDILNAGGFAGWNLGLLTGPLFATRRYNDYYYSVSPQYATPDRPAYQASGGYAGTQVLASLTKRYPKFWTGAYVRYDTLGGASFENSPLVKSANYWSAGIGIAWMIGHSSRLVAVPESESHYEPCNGCSNP